MANFVAGFLNDLSPVKDNIILRVRILRAWMQKMYGKEHIQNMELIIMDENNTRMQATIRMALVKQFKDQLVEGTAVSLERYSLGEIQPKYRMVNKALRISFLSNTVVKPLSDYTGSVYGFDFRTYTSIIGLKQEEDGQFDIIGHVTACDDLDNYDKNGKSGKKKPLTLRDYEGNELKCTLWGNFAQQFNDFLSTCADHGKLVVVLQLGMMKVWDGQMCVQNGYNGTKLFLFDATLPMEKEEFHNVKEYIQRLFNADANENSDNTSIRISTASKNSTKDLFTTQHPPKNIAELFDVAQGVTTIIVGTIIAIHEDEGWWYIGCHKCNKKVVRSQDIVDLEESDTKKTVGNKDDWYCTKCNSVTTIKTLFKVQLRVQDETGTISLTLWNDEVQPLVDRSAYQMCDKYGKVEFKDKFPTEITALVGKKYAFKVTIDSYNIKKLLPVFTVLRLSDDPDILDSIRIGVTPNKNDSEATSSTLRNITPLDLESQDENTTPLQTQKNKNTEHGEIEVISNGKHKRPADGEVGSESTNVKKKAVEVKIEKSL